jgi:NAD(P)-dependent dehydrogenase (short-subunit alcohol dehydrogenase family)
MSERLAGKVALVTGAAGGLGRAFSSALEDEGAVVAGLDLPGTASEHHADVRDFDEVGAVVEAVVQRHGRLDIVVSNAGIERLGFIHELSPSDWRDTLDVHVVGAFNVLRHTTPLLRDQRSGSVIVIGSAGAFTATVRHSPYGAAKAALFSIAYKASLDLQPHGVTVNCVWPGLARTGLVEHFAEDWRSSGLMSPTEYEDFLARAEPPEHIAPLVVFLASDEARTITGRTFSISGGQVRLVPLPQPGPAATASGEAWTVDELAAKLPELLPTDAAPGLGFGWSRRTEPLGPDSGTSSSSA